MAKARILIVDDEPDLIETVAFRLESNDYEVITADNGQDGLEKAKHENPSLIVLDLMLPKMSGYEVCTMLKNDTRFKDIPIVMFTAKAQEADQKLGVECGANAYIRKPFHGKELLETIESLLPVSKE